MYTRNGTDRSNIPTFRGMQGALESVYTQSPTGGPKPDGGPYTGPMVQPPVKAPTSARDRAFAAMRRAKEADQRRRAMQGAQTPGAQAIQPVPFAGAATVNPGEFPERPDLPFPGYGGGGGM